MSARGSDEAPTTSNSDNVKSRVRAAATTTTGGVKSKAPSKSQRQVANVEYSSMRADDASPGENLQVKSSSGESGNYAVKRQTAGAKRPMRAGAISVDQANHQATTTSTRPTRQQSQVSASSSSSGSSRPTAQQMRGDENSRETPYLVKSSGRGTSGTGNQQQQQQHQTSTSRTVGTLFANAASVEEIDDDSNNDSVLVETADDEELVADNSIAATELGSGGGGGGGDGSAFGSSLTAGLTRNLVWAVFASTVGSSFQHGYNGGVVNAPEKLIGEFVNETYYKRHGEPATEYRIDFIVALIVSIFCIGGCLGALATAFVADRIGRKEGLMYNNIIVLFAAPMMASSKAAASYELLIAGRFLIGINAGLNAGLAPLYLNEIAPIKLRGALGTIYQLVITISILLSNIFGLPSLLGDAQSWPILFVIPIIPAAFMLIALPHCCESPKHLILNQGRELQAQQALAWLRETGDVMEEMDELRTERELQTLQQRSISLADMLNDTCLRRPLTIAIVIMLSQQFSGINAVLFYSTSIFRDAGLGEQSAVKATLGMSVVNVAMTLVSLFLVDRAGRRTLHMTGLMGMAATCLVLAFCLTGANDPTNLNAMEPEQSSISSGLAVVAVYVFIAMFASGPGAIPWFLVAELFPSNARPLATSIAVAVNWLANFTVSLCFLPLTNVLHGFTFVLFAILLVIFYLFTYYKVPETKGASAEEISALFRR